MQLGRALLCVMSPRSFYQAGLGAAGQSDVRVLAAEKGANYACRVGVAEWHLGDGHGNCEDDPRIRR